MKDYIVEIYDEDSPDRFEILHERNDDEALREAFEICKNEGVTFLEMHEIDDKYEKIRFVG